MRSIRTIRKDEAESFLKLLCLVFELDYSRAQAVFFKEPLFDLNRKWALFEGGKMRSILTTVPLEFGWGKAIGIAGVATDVNLRGKGYALDLLKHVVKTSNDRGETAAYLFAKQANLYERAGFQVIDRVIKAPLAGMGENEDLICTYDDVGIYYNRWAQGHPARLRRPEKRWEYWRWNFRLCAEAGQGYVCQEGNVVREAVDAGAPESWPISAGSHWYGLRSMADHLGIDRSQEEEDLLFMGWRSPQTPQMFLTDQF
ncbi:MAG: GNAT family N-acetyltransferase [Fimbriimonadaceae bacterium]|nr:GNAT family N-acetyltransferase [Fimbriimonadaceae bacterium]